jgi:hypothetical protein
MLKSAEVEIKKEHNVLMVNKTTDFKKSGKSKKGPKGRKSQKDGKHFVGHPRAPKVKPGVKCFYCKGDGHWKRNCLKYLETGRLARLLPKRKVYLIYM